MTLPEPFANALILTGPTACGKSALSLELAERLDAEIIAMDSMTLYRGMDIGTAKPTVNDRKRIVHHLIDVLDPWESANVAWWIREAQRCSREIEQRGKQVLFVGGTPFYLKALLHGLFEAPAIDPEMRKRLENEAKVMGPEVFHARLADVDLPSAKRLHPNDVRRVVRAMEVWHSTGKRLSDLQRQGWWENESSGSDCGEATRHQSIDGKLPPCLVIDVAREELYLRINRRVDMMMEGGWVDEVRRLRDLPRQLSKEASKALGYQEIVQFLQGNSTFAETVETIKMRSRQFAKRQLTWFRSLSGCQLCERKLTFEVWRRKIL